MEAGDRITALVEAALSVRPRTENARLVPCLIGPTGAGKTSRIRELARARGLAFRTLLPGTSLPEDILGLPRVERDVTRWSLPDWAREARERPTLVLVDELDKARPETHAAILTLLLERRVRDVSLHPGTIIVAAMQPVEPAVWLSDETGRALAARLVFIRVHYDWAWVGGQYGVDLAWLPSPQVQLPLLPAPSARQVEWCLAALKQLSPTSAGELIRGVLPEEVAERLEQEVARASDPRVRIESLFDALVDEPSLVGQLTAGEIIALADVIGRRGERVTPALFEESLIRAHTLGEEVWRGFVAALRESFSQGGPKVIIGRPDNDDRGEFAAAIRRATERAAKFYIEAARKNNA